MEHREEKTERKRGEKIAYRSPLEPPERWRGNFCARSVIFAGTKLINRHIWNARERPTKEIKSSANSNAAKNVTEMLGLKRFKTLTRLLAARYLSGCCLEFSFKATYCILVPAISSARCFFAERESRRERELRQDLECVKENRMKRSVCTYIHLRPDESRFTRKFSVFLLIKAFYLLNGSFRWRC